MNKRNSNRQAFTLVELLVVISIIALLLSILMPALNRARSAGRQTVCLSQMRQFGLALEFYAQNNNGYAVNGRYHNNGDWLSINAFYSNLTPYLDPTKSVKQVWAMSNADAKKYNQIWQKLKCPSENKASKLTLFQGISIRSIGINIASGYTPRTSFDDGYGLQDWVNGKTRKLLGIRNFSGMLAFCETRDTEYIYNDAYTGSRQQGLSPDWYYPQRHPGGYAVTYVDGHCSIEKKKKILLGDPYDVIWRIK